MDFEPDRRHPPVSTFGPKVLGFLVSYFGRNAGVAPELVVFTDATYPLVPRLGALVAPYPMHDDGTMGRSETHTKKKESKSHVNKGVAQPPKNAGCAAGRCGGSVSGHCTLVRTITSGGPLSINLGF